MRSSPEKQHNFRAGILSAVGSRTIFAVIALKAVVLNTFTIKICYSP